MRECRFALHARIFFLRVLPLSPPLVLIFHGETMPSSKVFDYANAFAPSASKAIAIANARAHGFASRTSEVLCKNDLGRVQSASEARLSSWRYYAIAILGFLTL